MRLHLNRWVGFATMVISTAGVVSAWGEGHFWQLVSLWIAVGIAGAVLGYLWQRPSVAPGPMILASALSFVPLSSAMVFLDGGLDSSLWLLLLVGALSSAFAIHRMIYLAISLSLLGMIVSLWGPVLLTEGLRLGDGLQVFIRCATLLFVWVITHRIVLAQARDGHARLQVERSERRLLAEAAVLRERSGQQRKMEALGRLAGGVAHDFNNLLTIILNVGTGLQEHEGDDSEFAEDLQDLVSASEQAAALTQQLLTFSRGGTLKNDPVDLNELVESSARMLRRILPANIRVLTQVKAKRPVVVADRSELNQVLMNLALNSRDAIESKGEIRMVVSSFDMLDDPTVGGVALEPGQYLQIAVQDNGKGMSEEVRSRAMEPFFTTKEAGRGTGIGLASAYKVADRYGGALYIQSRLGKGTTVRFFIPRYIPDIPSASAAHGAPERWVHDESDTEIPVTASGARVIFVDDEPGVRRVVSRLLRSSGYHVTVYENAQQFLERTDQGAPYDALITDINMPGMSGIALARELERAGRVRPTVFISGYFADELDLQGFDTDCYGFLEKPLGRESLDAAIRDCMRRFRVAVGSRAAPSV